MSEKFVPVVKVFESMVIEFERLFVSVTVAELVCVTVVFEKVVSE